MSNLFHIVGSTCNTDLKSTRGDVVRLSINMNSEDEIIPAVRKMITRIREPLGAY